ncbi:hypothetical protein MNB_SM-4-1254 [hydrothermal vent metagenome]|uniref:Spondin domain-containing protein n=1 Tax=hydrothermal vent metagenome TaxID=652676 RepID=A0A1W1CLZ7_9ZZZZ
MKFTFTKLALTSALLMSSSLFATDITVKVTNLTSGINFTPLMVAAHPASDKVFTAGTAASASLQLMAEMGNTSLLVSDLSTADFANNTALLMPGASYETPLTTNLGNDYLTVVGMMLPTNDGFIAMNSMLIPTTAGTYTYTLNAWDAGTEGNDELAANIPNPAGDITSNGGTGLSSIAEGFVHIHRGNIGDSDTSGGLSDLDASKHRFLNPVASVTITVN